MKKLIILSVLMMSAVVFGFSQAQDVAYYEALYNASNSYTNQLGILNNMAKANVPDAGEFYAKVLRKLVTEYSNIKNRSEQVAVSDQVILLAALLGTEKYAPSAPDLWQVVEEFEAPKAKAEAMIALGTMEAAVYLPHIIRVLENLNMENSNIANRKNRITAENIAYGAIIALERYKEPSGYLPVFFASIGWYSKEVKDQAIKSLPLISDDPSGYMSDIIKGPGYDYPTKLGALKSTEAARIDNKIKVGIAVEALNQGWIGASSDTRSRTTFAIDMRKMSMQMINKYKTDDESIYPLLERSYLSGVDREEKLYAVATLASQGTAESAKRLSSFLTTLNIKRSSGAVNQEEEQMVRALIPALGKTGRTEARAALNAVSASNWTPAVINLANDALKQIN